MSAGRRGVVIGEGVSIIKLQCLSVEGNFEVSLNLLRCEISMCCTMLCAHIGEDDVTSIESLDLVIVHALYSFIPFLVRYFPDYHIRVL